MSPCTMIVPLLVHIVPGPVTTVTVPYTSPTRMKLAWEPPLTGCDVTQYNLTYQLVTVDQCSDQTVSAPIRWKRKRFDRPRCGLGSDPGSSPDKELLVPYSTYNITITASSLDGIGETYHLQHVTESTCKLIINAVTQ